jgi:hypothetical protein
MTNTKEPKPCDMPKEIVAGYFQGKKYWQDKDPLNEITDATLYLRVDQSPPLPDDVRGAVKEYNDLMAGTLNLRPVIHLEYEGCSQLRLSDEASRAIVNAATQQPEVVTFKQFSLETGLYDDFVKEIAKRYPHIKFVEG